MKTSAYVMLIVMVTVSGATHTAVAQSVLSERDAKREAVSAAVVDLKAAVDTEAETEKPRLGRGLNGVVRYFGAPDGAAVPPTKSVVGRSAAEVATDFIGEHGVAFGVMSPNTDFEVSRVRRDKGRTYVGLGQTHGGLPVFGATMIVQLDETGGVEAVMSDIMTEPEALDEERAALTPAIFAEGAEEAAIVQRLPYLEAAVYDYEAGLAESLERGDVTAETADSIRKALAEVDLVVSSDAELVIFDPGIVGCKGEPVLAWAFDLRNTGGHLLLAETVFANAQTGEIAFAYSLLHQAKDREVWNWDLDPDGTPELMRTETSGPVPSNVDWHLFYNHNFDILGQTYDYYYNTHGLDSYNGLGGAIISNMRYGSMPNAFWRHYSGTGEGEMYFGTYMYAVSDDVVAHEFTHGVTASTSILVYANQSGAINESMSDIWGEFVDWTGGWAPDDPEDRWIHGENTLCALKRNLKSPMDYRQPDTYKGQYWEDEVDNPDPNNDYGGVHTNSGVGNKLCYLLTDGDTFNGYTVSGLGESIVQDLYWECQTNLLCPASDYSHLYFALKQAAVNLSLSQAQCDAIEAACCAVGIGDVRAFTVRDGDGTEWLQFQSDGDLVVMNGIVVENASLAQLTPSSSRTEWIVQLGGGQVLALLNLDDGNFYIKGTVTTEATSLTADPNDAELVIGDSLGVALAIIDSQGNLTLRGRQYVDED